MFTSIHKTTGVIKHFKTEMAMEWKQLYEQVTDGGMGSRSVLYLENVTSTFVLICPQFRKRITIGKSYTLIERPENTNSLRDTAVLWVHRGGIWGLGVV